MIEEGFTTQKEIRDLFGSPNKITKNLDGSETWKYQSEDVVMKSFVNNTIWAVAGLVRSWIPEAIIPPTMATPMVSHVDSGYSLTILFDLFGIVKSTNYKR